jgi:hypothetical protein
MQRCAAEFGADYSSNAASASSVMFFGRSTK